VAVDFWRHPTGNFDLYSSRPTKAKSTSRKYLLYNSESPQTTETHPEATLGKSHEQSRTVLTDLGSIKHLHWFDEDTLFAFVTSIPDSTIQVAWHGRPHLTQLISEANAILASRQKTVLRLVHSGRGKTTLHSTTAWLNHLHMPATSTVHDRIRSQSLRSSVLACKTLISVFAS